MGLTESVILTKIGDLLWILLALEFFHDGKPIGHLFAIFLLYKWKKLLAITI